MTAVAVLKNAGSNQIDIVSSVTGKVFVAKSLGVGYDADGNLTNDGRWAYSWDAENRLIAMETLPAAVQAGAPKQKLLFGYDHQSRRISKVVSNWTGSGWVCTRNLRFVYDGWNVLAELDTTNAVLRSYVWGLDLSDTEQGAGGIGGLLWTTFHPGSSMSVCGYAHDGNGNVVALVDMATGRLLAEYDYGPFGEPIRTTGPLARANPFRFSTKYTDPETGLLYYGYRYYSPTFGRWLSRDPIGEQLHAALYAFVGNNSVGNVDFLGLLVADALRQQVELIDAALAAGATELAAANAYQLYWRLAWGGAWTGKPFASEMLQHWLNRGGPKTLSERRVRQLVQDKNVSSQFAQFLGDQDGAVQNRCTQVTPVENSDNYYAMGTFTLCFTGCHSSRGGCTIMRGTWAVSDIYDWHDKASVYILGVEILDDYAILVEKTGRAQAYPVRGTWEGKVNSCGPSEEGGR
ncbi:MAG: RHS repeat-associated core domain-containing protein [Verrucomicrobiae bacterium]|nr:RHS repeat-associated core domain-containing protein [Verrucomicrobiae bacterium]